MLYATDIIIFTGEPIMKDARQRTTPGVSPCLWALALLLVSSLAIQSATGIRQVSLHRGPSQSPPPIFIGAKPDI